MRSKHLDLNKVEGLHDPITFTVGKKTYKVVPITRSVMDENLKIADEHENPFDIFTKQLACLTGAPAEEFDKMTIGELTHIVRHITEVSRDPLLGSLPSAAQETPVES